MVVTSRFADIAQKSMVLFLAGTTVYYMVNVGVLVNRRIHLKKEGKLEEELARMSGNFWKAGGDSQELHAETQTTPTPVPSAEQPGDLANIDS
ncbi:hypothetical protein J3Q64DRAFT_1835165 [Phycomyces blakesleeanus]|uniref:Uncharacterized protein n=2 Tax=Phycomyces blakesleeanus TaxID=4837 RepID=A0A167MNG5_PHYB8|nr:hypothetical protein PHYBLDRAFT_145763 [Phycomyces blakesleeanus NRRL 1555(-)]OAD73366.1 hypothetical protein PHYBLDRAFT_145763 [Phycomyces blakesleeanus NRRL 1555(-)]|eukprot:XP_018291406.1 hypothetical protein PHYBLDRAFT_145763 [Phycomyces blakesleeanus NRRL 1555(-)]